MGSISPLQESLVKPSFPVEATTEQYAQSLDLKDHMRSFRERFIIPSKANIKAKKLAKPGGYSQSTIEFTRLYQPSLIRSFQ